MFTQIILGSDWWIYFLVSLLLFVFLYLFEAKYLKKEFKAKAVTPVITS